MVTYQHMDTPCSVNEGMIDHELIEWAYILSHRQGRRVGVYCMHTPELPSSTNYWSVICSPLLGSLDIRVAT